MKKNPSWPVVIGPLESFVAGYREELLDRLGDFLLGGVNAHVPVRRPQQVAGRT